jgi:N-acetylmuramoyl-L-alanine amidase
MMPLKYLLGLFFIVVLNIGLEAQKKRPFIVVLDAGHGGKDGGAVGSRAIEKKIALKIVLELGRLLESQAKGIKVYYTRKKDVFIPLEKRSEIANNKNANLFISVHCNASFDGSGHAQGSETFVLGNKGALSEQMRVLMERENNLSFQAEATGNKKLKNTEKHILASLYQRSIQDNSLILAGIIEKQFKISLRRTSRGVKQAGFVVLKDVRMPAVLVEAGFLTNSSDQNFLMGAINQKRVAKAIYTAVLAYKQKTTFYKHFGNNSLETNPSNTQPDLTYAADVVEEAHTQNRFYVQLASSITKFDLTATRWKTHTGQVQCVYYKGRYRCISMKGGTRENARNLLKHWKRKGFSEAFIVQI